MRELAPETITDAVLDQMATTPDPRLKTIMASAARESEADKTSGRVGAAPSAIMKRSAKSEPAPVGVSV